jgi:hypothetical protein
MARPKGSTNKTKPAPIVVAEAEATEAKSSDKPIAAKSSGVTITKRFHEPYGRDAFDVSYSFKGETLTDKGFLTREAAEAHVKDLGL